MQSYFTMIKSGNLPYSGEGEVKMILPHQGKTKMQGLSHVKHESITEWNEGEEFTVPLKMLDNVLNGQTIQGIKIDVENFEYYALKGGRRILTDNKPIIYAELWDIQTNVEYDYNKIKEVGE